MKKLFIILFLLVLTGCQTKEEIEKQKKEEEIQNITEEINKKDVPESTKEWLIKNESEKVLTILCITTSNKCKELKENINTLKEKITTYYLNVDKLNDEELLIYKTKYELKDYNSYLPYIFVGERNKLLTTIKDEKDVNKILTVLIDKKIVSQN